MSDAHEEVRSQTDPFVAFLTEFGWYDLYQNARAFVVRPLTILCDHYRDGHYQWDRNDLTYQTFYDWLSINTSNSVFNSPNSEGIGCTVAAFVAWAIHSGEVPSDDFARFNSTHNLWQLWDYGSTADRNAIVSTYRASFLPDSHSGRYRNAEYRRVRREPREGVLRNGGTRSPSEGGEDAGEPGVEKENLVVLYGSYPICTIRASEKDKYIQEVSYLNRWYYPHGGNGKLSFAPTDYPVTDPYKRGWEATWVVGRAGWMCVPARLKEESVIANSANEQAAYVFAPSALLAIERVKYLLGTPKYKKRRED